jgi:hypothetical protein
VVLQARGNAAFESAGDFRVPGNGDRPLRDLYFEVARAPERGLLLAAVGLLGKVLGPIGMIQLIWTGAWPRSALALCLTNDFLWWSRLARTSMTRGPAFAPLTRR